MVISFFYRTLKTRNGATLVMTLLTVLMVSGCGKEEPFVGSPATVQLFNALDDDIVLISDLSGKRPQFFYSAHMIYNKAGFDVQLNNFHISNAVQPLDLYTFPDTMAHNKPLLSINLELERGHSYSLFVFGDKTEGKYLLHKDNIPPLKKSDSVTNFRFANFGNPGPISVNLKGEPAGSFIQQLPFEGLSEFIEMNAKKSVGQYEFEFRDQSSGNLLATYIADYFNSSGGNDGVNKWYNKSNTLVFTGHPGGTGMNEQKVYLMNHR